MTKIAFDTCVYINLMGMEKIINNYCKEHNAKLSNIEFDFLHLDKNKTDMKIAKIYYDIFVAIKNEKFQVVMLPKVLEECTLNKGGYTSKNIIEFMLRNNIELKNFTEDEKCLIDELQTMYITKGETSCPFPPDYKNSKHPLNDSINAAQSFMAGCRFVTADNHFSKTFLTYEKNLEFCKKHNYNQSIAGNVPIMLSTFAKTKLFKDAKKEKQD